MMSVAHRASRRYVEAANSLRMGHPPSAEILGRQASEIYRIVTLVGLRAWLTALHDVPEPSSRHPLLTAGVMALVTGLVASSEDERVTLVTAAWLHDIGKALIDPTLLNWPGRLSDSAMGEVRNHARFGYEALHNAGDFKPDVLDVARHHHEYLDGTGYPDRLSDDAISMSVRLATICDVFAALIELRPYKKAMSPCEALSVMDGFVGRIDWELFERFKALINRSLW